MGQTVNCGCQAERCCKRKQDEKDDLLVPRQHTKSSPFMDDDADRPEVFEEGTHDSELPNAANFEMLKDGAFNELQKDHGRFEDVAMSADVAVFDSAEKVPMGAGRLPRWREISVTVQTSAEAPSIGVDVEHGATEPFTLRVARVCDGPVCRWNEEHDVDQIVRGGDHLIAVNGVSGHPSQIAHELQQSAGAPVLLLFQRQDEFELCVTKENVETDLGVHVDVDDMRVNQVRIGPVLDYNLALPHDEQHFMVMPGDHIVEVNGARNVEDALACVRNACVLHMVIRRGVPPEPPKWD
eukprot:TRINITY_DN54587_c0_g1_i1.p1 TRINITY_DN54587_c0_g1~~TRINITY_DN54587_c0_g1_i1.p1  ORF type:complete len:296 (+),score=49.86 TRINITY_DN54587_c0_g1_i1:76-963(+)